jgi:hypothetical protein
MAPAREELNREIEAKSTHIAIPSILGCVADKDDRRLLP